MSEPVLEIDGLDVTYHTASGPMKAVSDASFTLGANEYFGLVGESGCGKSTLAQAITQSLDANGEISAGTVTYKGEEVQDLPESEFNEEIRWQEIAVIPQSAMNSLDPLSRVSEQAVEVAEAHTDWSTEETLEKLKELFGTVGLPESRVRDYPHQFSGGMKQRAIIAFSLLLDPSMIIADEPTTALDVIMQDQFLKHLDELREVRDFSLLFITHDIAVVFEMCNSMAVMHGGQIAERGDTTAIFDESRHPYTILLQQAFPDIRFPNRELEGIEGTPPSLQEDVTSCTFADRCPWAEEGCWEGEPPLEEMPGDDEHAVACIRSDEMETLAADYLEDERQTGAPASDPTDEGTQAGTDGVTGDDGESDPVLELRDLHKHFDPSTNIFDTIRHSLFGSGEQDPVRAVDGVDLTLEENQIQGIIGESGCGKSTLLQTVMGKYDPTEGDVVFDGQSSAGFDKSDWKEFRRRVQIIFQDPFNTLNPHFTVRETLLEPLRIHDMEHDEGRVLDMLEQVRLTPAEEYIDRNESQLSGGEKQRVAIARALILEPDVILADEPVSMLDVSHDLSTVSYVCDRVNVMYLGRIVESAPTMELLDEAKHPYTRALLQAIPVPDPHHEREWAELPGTPGDATDLPSGCRFKDRCPERMDICDTRPEFVDVDGTAHGTACHLHYDHAEVADAAPTAVGDGGDPQ